MAPDQVAKAEEISEMDAGHIVDNGKRKTPEEVTPQMMWKKLEAIQEDQREIKERLKDLEESTKPAGGRQPKEKFSVDIFFEEKAGQVVQNQLGKELVSRVKSNGYMDKNEFQEFMEENGWSSSSPNTILNWMKKVSSRFDYFSYEVGEKGGNNKPSRIVHEGY
jgi:hypothetical protein